MRPSSALLFAASPLLSAALGFLTVPLLTWNMPPHVIAQFGLFQYASSAFLIMVTCGFDQAFLRELAGQRVPSGLLRNALLPCLGILGILGILALIWSRSDQAVNLFGTNAPWLIPLLVVNVTFLTFQRFGAQQTRMKQNGGLAFFMAELVLRAPLVILLVLLVIKPIQGLESSPFIAIALGTALSAMVLIGANFGTWARLLSQTSANPGPPSLQLFKFGAPLAFAGILYWGMGNTGPYLTQALHGSEDTARLVVAISVANIATIGQTMFSLFWLPIVYKKMESGLLPCDVELTARRVCAGAAIFFVLAIIALHLLQYFLGDKFRDIAPLATALCVLPALYTISEVTYVGLMAIRKSGAALTATAAALAASVLANIVLVPSLGAPGAGAATAIAAFVFLLGRTEMACKFWQKFHRRTIYFGAASIMCAGLIAPWLPVTWGPLSLLVLLPYLFFEKRVLYELLCIAKNVFFKKKYY